MIINKKEVSIFLQEILVNMRVLWSKDQIQIQSIPKYLSDTYQMNSGSVNGLEIIFAHCRFDEPPTVPEMERHYRILKKASNTEIVFVFKKPKYDFTPRLIKRQLPFVELEKQVYMPFFFLKLKTARKKIVSERESLTPWAAIITIRQLITGDLEGLNGRAIAEKLKLTPNNVSRALPLLQDFGICEIIEEKTAKIVRFKARDELWFNARAALRSPVKYSLNVAKIPSGLPITISGEQALSRYGMLASPEIDTYAAHAKLFPKNMINAHENLDQTVAILEIWDRDPALTCTNLQLVDPISLYLTMRDSQDDRIRISLQELMKEVGLSIEEEFGQ